MKFSLEKVEPGITVCHITQPLTVSEANQIVAGIQKLLANGKARIILNFSTQSSQEPAGAVFLEKSLRHLKLLAKKMGGDIKYSVPPPVLDQVLDAKPNLGAAVQSFLGIHSDSPVDVEKLKKELTIKDRHIQQLTQDNEMLLTKVKELLEFVRRPSADVELQKAVEHYKTLATEAEAAKPAEKV